MENIKKFSSYYDFLKKEIMQFRGPIKEYVFYLPSLFKLLTDILNNIKLSPDDRKLIFCALGYFVTPDDIIPEEIYGPAGYIDDIFLCSWVLKKLIKKYNVNFFLNYWDNENDPIDEVVEYCQEETSKDLKDKKNDIFEFVGIKDE